MDIVLEKFKRLPFSTILAARNYGMDNIAVPSDARLGSKLCMAILRGDNREMSDLLSAGAPMDHREEPDGWTPLIYSIYYGNNRARQELIARGADIAQGDYADRTPLMFAAIKGDTALVNELLSLGADRNARDARGKSAGDFAKEYLRDECANLLK